MKTHFKRFIVFVIAMAMLFSLPLDVITADNSSKLNALELEAIKLPDGETAEDFIKNPAQPDLYTLRSDYRVERNGDYVINYQPYVATVGAAASQAEKDKVNKTITLPDFSSFLKPQKNFIIDYDTVVAEAQNGQKSGDSEYGVHYQKSRSYDYAAFEKKIKIKHVFQDLKDFEKYGPKPGETEEIETTQDCKVGSNLVVKPLSKDQIAGFIPEADSITVQVPEITDHFFVEYRYNRNHYDVTFDTDGGTEVSSRTLYYGQVIPNLDTNEIPTKVGATFQGWKPSVDLIGEAGKTFKKDEPITDASGKAIKDLKAELTMPAENVKFTAVWKDNEKADYAIQFWTEKADHDEDASLLEKYDFVGTHVYRGQATGTRPDLANETVKGVEFPDLDQARLDKIWNNERFYRNFFLFLNKFYKYNKDLTDKENADPNSPNLVKAVSSTGKTVYNIYYDRQVYDLYFTKSNAKTGKDAGATFYPEIWRHGVKLGEPGKPYHFKARFNQLMTEWPNDAEETKGFSPGKQSYGWGPNFNSSQWQYRDTPPYRLSADEFLDMKDYIDRGGYTNEIDAGNGVTLDVNWNANPKTFTTLSFGIEQRGRDTEGNQPMPHHMDFWMDGFTPGETIIDYNLYRTKSDTSSETYGHKYPKVQGFTPYPLFEHPNYPASEVSVKLTEDELAAVNDERAAVTPFPNETVIGPYEDDVRTKGKMKFMYTFFNRADEWGDVADGSDPFETNGYIRFKYHRNKYKLRFNNDPAKLKDDSEYNSTNQTEVFYQKPLKDLNLDNPQTLIDLGLTDLVEKDDEGKDRIKRPDGLGDQMVFKGWALDPAGKKLVWENKETMPAHNLVLYAKWGEPDYKWKVTFDPNGGKLDPIDEKNVTTARKTIREGDIADQKEVTYAKKGENEGDKQVFTVVQRQKLVEPQKPTRKGYSFMGWEVLRYKKDGSGNYTEEVDTNYHDTYGVPELYSYGNDVVSPIYLKAIWVKNDRLDVKVYHHFLDGNFAKDTTADPNPVVDTMDSLRAGQYIGASGNRQDAKWILATDSELGKTKDQDIKEIYDEYNSRVGFNNTFFQTIKIEPAKILEGGNLVDNPNFKNNVFHFFYRPFRTRHYKVNYVDERARAELDKATTDAEKKAIIEKYRILDQEEVTSEARHYDAKNYKPINGWKLTSDPQQQLFYDVDEDTNEFKGINGTGSDEITFFYKDVRVIDVPKNVKTPEGYIRVTFKASEGGSFGKDKNGDPIKEINYVVLKGVKAGMISVPENPTTGAKDENKYYITPDQHYSFVKWDNKPLLDPETVIDNTEKDYYVFTAEFNRNKVKITTSVVNGTIDPSGIAYEYEGENKTINYAPKAGYKLKSVTVDGVNVDISEYPNNYTFTNLAKDHEIVVVYELITYSVTYIWDGDAPAGCEVPKDTGSYHKGDKCTVDTTYKAGDTVEGEKDGKQGIWTFNGWDKTGDFDIDGNTVIKGSWTFKEKPVKPTEPTTTSESTKPTEPTTTSESTKPTDPTTTSEKTKPTEPTTTSEKTKPTEPTTTSESTKPTAPTTTSESTKPTEPTTTSESTKPTEPTTTSEPTKPTEPTTTSEPTKPTEPTTTSESTKPTEPTTTSESTKPTAPTETINPTESTKLTEPTKPTYLTIPTVSTKPTKRGGNIGNVPKTGENQNHVLGISLMALAGFGIAGSIIYGRKKRKKSII